jgi:hypothetical protein
MLTEKELDIIWTYIGIHKPILERGRSPLTGGTGEGAAAEAV